MAKDNKNDFNLDINGEVAEGVYSNLVVISHNPTEFVLDFSQMFPGAPNPVVRSRVVMHPVHVKRLLYALQENISKYEEHIGAIEEPGGRKALPGDTVPYDFMGKA